MVLVVIRRAGAGLPPLIFRQAILPRNPPPTISSTYFPSHTPGDYNDACGGRLGLCGLGQVSGASGGYVMGGLLQRAGALRCGGGGRLLEVYSYTPPQYGVLLPGPDDSVGFPPLLFFIHLTRGWQPPLRVC